MDAVDDDIRKLMERTTRNSSLERACWVALNGPEPERSRARARCAEAIAARPGEQGRRWRSKATRPERPGGAA